MRLVLAFALIASPLAAQDSVSWNLTGRSGLPSVLTLAPTEAPGAVAEVQFMNEEVHQFNHQVVDLVLDGLAVEVLVNPNYKGGVPDMITVTPPEGYVAVPTSLLLAEGEAGRIVIYSTEGTGR